MAGRRKAAEAAAGDAEAAGTTAVEDAPAEEEAVEAEVAEEEPEPQATGELSEAASEMALAIREERGLAIAPQSSLPSPKEWEAMVSMATEIASSRFVPESYRGDGPSVIAAIQTGRELGIGPMQSLRDIHMIDGRPVFSATLMLAQMRRGGVRILESESTIDRAYIRAERKDTGEIAAVEWTYAEAEVITRRGKKLVDGDNWKNYRADMLWARCVGRLARRLGSDLLAGMVYSSEELRDLDDSAGGYGASTRQPAAPAITWENLDPGKYLHPDAPKGWKDILAALQAVDAGIDWTEVVKRILVAVYKVETVRELSEESAQAAGRRLANLAAYLADVVMEKREFPPPSDAEIVAAVAWAFDGLVVEIPESDPAAVEAAQEAAAAAAAEAPAEAVEGEVIDEGGDSDAALTPELQQELANAEVTDVEFGK